LKKNIDIPKDYKFLPGQEYYKVIEGEILPKGILPPSYYLRIESLRGIYRARYKEGKWTAFEGLVYPFDPMKHVISRKKFEKMFPNGFPSGWKTVIDVDFGYEHPFVCHWWKVSPENVWYLYREIYHTKIRPTIHGKNIVRFCKEDKVDPIAICDWDAAARADLRSCGIKTIKAKKDKILGQNAVEELFELNHIFFLEDALVEKDQSLEIAGKPTCTVDEFAGHIWLGKGKKEGWVEEDDHGMDGMRYGIYTTKKRAGGQSKPMRNKRESSSRIERIKKEAGNW
jgi:phage terminase large subunit